MIRKTFRFTKNYYTTDEMKEDIKRLTDRFWDLKECNDADVLCDGCKHLGRSEMFCDECARSYVDKYEPEER